jgi:hypothetical protein
VISTERTTLYQLRLARYRDASNAALDAAERFYQAPPGSNYAIQMYEDLQAARSLERFTRRLLDACDV